MRFPAWPLDDAGFTGLEVAIVLIAFVVVASVFSYTVLGLGFMATQKTHEIANGALGKVSGGLELRGQMMGFAPSEGAAVESLRVVLSSNTATGVTVDLGRMAVQIATDEVVETLERGTDLAEPEAGEWTVVRRDQSTGTPNNVLEPNEQVTIAIRPSNPLAPGTSFTLELRPDGGAPVILKRTVPAYPARSSILY